MRGRSKGTDSTYSSNTHRHTQAEDLRPSDSAQYSTVQYSTAQHCTAHGTAQSIKAQHTRGDTRGHEHGSTAQHSAGEDQWVLQVSKVV